MKGLEPPRLSAPDPKSGAATNYATSAWLLTNRFANIHLLRLNNLNQEAVSPPASHPDITISFPPDNLILL